MSSMQIRFRKMFLLPTDRTKLGKLFLTRRQSNRPNLRYFRRKQWLSSDHNTLRRGVTPDKCSPVGASQMSGDVSNRAEPMALRHSSEEGTIYRAPTLSNRAKRNGAEDPSATTASYNALR